MNQSSNRGKRNLVVGILIFSIGVFIGLVVLGWWLWPVEWEENQRVVEVTRIVEIIVTQVVTNTAEEEVIVEIPEPEPPVEQPRISGKVLIIYNHSDLSKLEALGFLNGIEVELDRRSAFDDPTIAGVLFEDYPRPEDILNLDSILRRGGRVIIMYDELTFDMSQDVIRDMFNVVHAEEKVVRNDSQYFRYANNILPTWLKGLNIAITCRGDWNARIDVYLNTNSPNYEEGYLNSHETEKERLLLLSKSGGNLIFIPDPCEFEGTFYGDRNIDQADNEEASLRLLQFLSGGELEPITQSPRPENITEEHIATTRILYEQVSNGDITQEEADAELVVIMTEIGKDGLAWIVSHTPIYSEEHQSWITINDLLGELDKYEDINPNSRLKQDPVGTAVDLFFGDFESSDILNWLGFDE